VDCTSSDVLARRIDELVRHTVAYRGLAEMVAATTGEASAFGQPCERVHSAGGRLVRREQQRGIVRADVRQTMSSPSPMQLPRSHRTTVTVVDADA
jgi:hypothetical protein